MFEIPPKERVDWFRIIADILQCGYKTSALSRVVDIPESTLKDYKDRKHRPKLEEGVKILYAWSDITGKSIDIELPTYNPYIPDHLQAPPPVSRETVKP